MKKEAAPSSRRKARVFALQALYEEDISGHALGLCLDRLRRDEPVSKPTVAFALRLTQGIYYRRNDLDALIVKFAPAWPVKDLSVVDRNILRMALFETVFSQETPLKVAINEAVELAKTFGSESSPRFVNGVLGSVVASRKDSFGPPDIAC